MGKDKEVKVNMFTFNAGEEINTPVFRESKAEWIPYGNKNNYDAYLVDLLNTSTKHNSLIKKKVNMTAGHGFKETITNKEYINNVNGKEDLNEIAFKNAYDLMTYGGFAQVVTWSKDKISIARTTFIGWDKIRIAKDVEQQDNPEMYKRQQDGVTFYYICSDWMDTKKNEPELIQGFSEVYKDESTQLIYEYDYRVGVDYYTYPDYISAVNYIELDKEIANFHLSSVKNGFTPSFILSLKGGIPSDEEMKMFNRKLQKDYSGSSNASKIFTMYSENAESAPELIPISLNNSDERFIQLEEQIQQNIVLAHGASPIVAGIAISGKLGNSDEILEAETVFQKNVIDAKQNKLERAFNLVTRINGVEPLELEGIKSFENKNLENAN